MTQGVLAWVLAGVLLPAVGWAEEAAPRHEEGEFGAVVVPVALPEGATALYGYAGAPEVGGGFRQGLGAGFEFEARARFNWFQASGALEAVGRKQVWTRGALSLAPTLGLGLVLNSGATYLEDVNESGVLLRVAPGALATWRVAETVAVLGQVDLPFDIGLSPGGARRFQALGGGGAEVYVGSDLTLSAVGQLGVETYRRSLSHTETGLGWAVRLGLGVRLF